MGINYGKYKAPSPLRGRGVKLYLANNGRVLTQTIVEKNGGSVAGSVASMPVIDSVKTVIAKLKVADSGSNTVKINASQTITITAGNLFGSYDNATAFDADDIQINDYSKFEFVMVFTYQLSSAEKTAYENGDMFKYDQNCKAAYMMNLGDHDPTNVRTLDRSRNWNHAQFGDGSTSSTFPTYEKGGYNFDGSTDYLTLSNSVLDIAQPFSAFVLLKKEDKTPNNYDRIFSFNDDADNYLQVVFDETGVYGVEHKVGGVFVAENLEFGNYNLQMNMVGVVYDGTNIKFYVNAVEISTTGTVSISSGSTYTYVIGERSSLDGITAFKGKMHSVFLHQAALNETQIVDLYNRMKANFYSKGRG